MNLRRLCDNKLCELLIFIGIPVISGAVCLIIGRSLISRDWQLVYREPSFKPPEWAVVLIWLAGALVLSGFILLTIWRARNSSFRIVPILYPLVAYGIQHILAMIYLLFYMGLTSPLVAALINLAHCIVVLVCIILLWKWNFRKASLMFIVYWLWLLYCAVFTWGAFHKFLHTPYAAPQLLVAVPGVDEHDNSVVSYITANDTTNITTMMPTAASTTLVPAIVVVPEVPTSTMSTTEAFMSNITTLATTLVPPVLRGDGSRGVGRAVEIVPPLRVSSGAPTTNMTLNNTDSIDGHTHLIVPEEHDNITTLHSPTEVESQPVG